MIQTLYSCHSIIPPSQNLQEKLNIFLPQLKHILYTAERMMGRLNPHIRIKCFPAEGRCVTSTAEEQAIDHPVSQDRMGLLN